MYAKIYANVPSFTHGDALMEKFDPDTTIDACWVVDSETSIQYLMDRKTNKILAKWRQAHKHEYHYNSEHSTREADVYTCSCKKEIVELSDAGGGC